MYRTGFLSLLLILLLSGCGTYGAPAGGEAAGSFEITSPAAGASVEGPSVTLQVEVANLLLQTPGGGNQPNQGHLHLYLDGGSDYDVVYEATHALALAPGEHTLRVELRNNDHSPLSPPVAQEVSFTVTGNYQVPAGEATPTPYSYSY